MVMDLMFYYVNNINILDYNSTESCNLKNLIYIIEQFYHQLLKSSLIAACQ